MFFDEPKIVIGEDVKIQAEKGEVLTCRMEISKEGYIPDLYIHFSEDNIRRYNLDAMELYDDPVFIRNVMRELKKQGFEGKPFGRAELGMQGDTFIALEPGQDFCKWVEDIYGWIDLDKVDRKRLIQ